MNLKKIIAIIWWLAIIENAIFLGLMAFRVFTPPLLMVVWMMPASIGVILFLTWLRMVIEKEGL
jgi:hypothetical protein